MAWGKIYNGKRILLTGHTGFKGSWLTTWLNELGAVVTGYSLAPTTNPSLFTAAAVADHCTSILGDVRDTDRVKEVVTGAAPHIVFHLAAQPLVRKSYDDPIGTFATNILGTANILEACRATPSVQAIVVVTTDKVYQNYEWVWPFRESDRLGGSDPYSASKACAELVTSVYRDNLLKASNVRIASARGGNVVGGGDWSEDRLVPDIIRAFASGSEIVLRSPKAVRPWQHVLELCEGYLELGARLASGDRIAEGSWNFGPRHDGQLTVIEITQSMLETLGNASHPLRVEAADATRKESQLLRLDTSKALAELSWRPRLTARETIAWTASWYTGFAASPSNARELMIGQLEEFNRKRQIV